jgi:hypothetical protein
MLIPGNGCDKFPIHHGNAVFHCKIREWDYFGLTTFNGENRIIILSAAIYQHVRHGYGTVSQNFAGTSRNFPNFIPYGSKIGIYKPRAGTAGIGG